MKIKTFCFIEKEEADGSVIETQTPIILDTSLITVALKIDDDSSRVNIIDGFECVIAMRFEEIEKLMEPQATYFHERIE